MAAVVTAVGICDTELRNGPGWAIMSASGHRLAGKEGPLFEYACHEGNYDVRHLLEIYRNLEIQAAADASPQDSK